MQNGRALPGAPLLLESWLRRRRAITVAWRFLSFIALLVVGVLALVITFFFTYAIVWLGYNLGVVSISELLFGKSHYLSHRSILIVCWSFLAFLFLTNARVKRDYWNSGSVSRSQWSSLWMAGAIGSLAALLVNPSASAKAISGILLTGPRLLVAALVALRETWLVFNADIRVCSEALTVLFRRERSLSADDLRRSLGSIDPAKILTQLFILDTVLLLRLQPRRFTLDPELRDLLQQLLGEGATSGAWQSPPAGHAAFPLPEPGPFQLLGLAPTASLVQVRAAFRKKMKECHPDIFATHSDEVRNRAEEKTKAIIAAYDEILAQFRNPVVPQ
jgi:hypothetical protein